MFDPMNLKALTDDDLARLLEAFRLLADEGNRFFFDCYILIELESLSRVKPTKPSEYSENDLGNAIVALSHILNGRALSDAEQKTIKTFLGVACSEMHRRQHDRVLN